MKTNLIGYATKTITGNGKQFSAGDKYETTDEKEFYRLVELGAITEEVNAQSYYKSNTELAKKFHPAKSLLDSFNRTGIKKDIIGEWIVDAKPNMSEVEIILDEQMKRAKQGKPAVIINGSFQGRQFRYNYAAGVTA